MTAQGISFFAPDSELHGVLARQRELAALDHAIAVARQETAAAAGARDTAENELKARQQEYHAESMALSSQQRRCHDLELELLQLKQTADSVWVLLGLKAFVAAVVGGIGNVRGAMLGGIAIGLIEFFGVAYLSSNYRDVYVFLVLILVLLLRPEGLLGRATVEKV